MSMPHALTLVDPSTIHNPLLSQAKDHVLEAAAHVAGVEEIATRRKQEAMEALDFVGRGGHILLLVNMLHYSHSNH